MSINADHLRRVMALGLAPEALKEVLSIIADVQDDGSAKRARQARNRRYYEKTVLKRLNSASEIVLETTENVLNSSRAPTRECVHNAKNLESKKQEESKIQSSLRSDLFAEPVNGHSVEPPKPKPKRDTSEADRIVEGFLAGYSALASQTGLPSYRALTNRRRSCILARAKDLIEALDFPDPMAGFAELFAKIRAGPHLLGQNDRGWKCDVDWIITESNFLKIMEDKYAQKPKQLNYAGHQSHRPHYG